MALPWLAHHGEEDLDRCVRIGPLAVCRRCLVLWPLTWGFLALLVALGAPAQAWWDVLVPVLLLPPVVEFVGVHVGRWSYRPARVWALTPLLAAALARLLHRLVLLPADPWSTGILAIAGLACGWAVLRFHAERREAALDPDRIRLPPPGVPGDPP